MKKNTKITLSAVSAFVILTVAACLYVGIYMVRYALQPELEYDEQKEIGLLSDRTPGLTEWTEDLIASGDFKDTSTVIGGLDKHAYLIPAMEPSSKTAVVIHGYTSNPIHMMYAARMFRDMGYNVILPHLHYHGFSGGDAIQMGWKDRLDVMQWMEIAHERFCDSLMVIYGVSMGGATTMMVSGEELPEYVKGFIEDCGYTSVWDEFAHESRKRYNVPEFPVLYSADLVCWLKYGWHFKEASSVDQLAKCSLPMMFIHGDKDDFVPYRMLEQNYDAKTQGYKEMWSVPGVPHAESYRTYPEEYVSRIRTFLQNHVEQ